VVGGCRVAAVGQVTKLVQFANTTWSAPESPTGNVRSVLPMRALNVLSVILGRTFIKQTAVLRTSKNAAT